MPSRLITAFIFLTVFGACYACWFGSVHYLVPIDFGMPDYEEQLELAFLAGTVAFGMVPVILSMNLIAYLNEHLLASDPQPIVPHPPVAKNCPTGRVPPNSAAIDHGNPYQSPQTTEHE